MEIPNLEVKNQFLIIDFDSTFVKSEALEELASVALRDNPQKNEILEEIIRITNEGMEGTISFTESLDKRIAMLQGNYTNIQEVIGILNSKISTSILRNKEFFMKNASRIYVVTGGFQEITTPIVTNFGIPDSHIFANNFIFNVDNFIIGIDKNNPLSKTGGKTEIVKSLNLQGHIVAVGDGYTDFQIKAAGQAEKFYAFTENIVRKSVISNADLVVSSFDEVISDLQKS